MRAPTDSNSQHFTNAMVLVRVFRFAFFRLVVEGNQGEKCKLVSHSFHGRTSECPCIDPSIHIGFFLNHSMADRSLCGGAVSRAPVSRGIAPLLHPCIAILAILPPLQLPIMVCHTVMQLHRWRSECPSFNFNGSVMLHVLMYFHVIRQSQVIMQDADFAGLMVAFDQVMDERKTKEIKAVESSISLVRSQFLACRPSIAARFLALSQSLQSR